jgi:uncharacterized membrane protein YphA (DoxX/SURF4 family)
VAIADLLGDGLRIFLGLAFLWYGVQDVRPSPARKAEFRRWRYPPWTQPFGGVLQLLSVGLLILPETVLFAAAILFAMMAFSVYTHLVREYRPHQVPWPAFLGVLAIGVGYLYGHVAWGPAGEIFRAIFPHS